MDSQVAGSLSPSQPGPAPSPQPWVPQAEQALGDGDGTRGCCLITLDAAVPKWNSEKVTSFHLFAVAFLIIGFV